MNRSRLSLFYWAARESTRHPGEGLLMAAALFTLVALVSAVLLLNQAWTRTTTALLEAGPSLVVRRVNQGGWIPLDGAAAAAAANRVIGVIDAVPRVWGVVSGPEGAVTVVRVDEDQAAELTREGLTAPLPGEAVVGPGVAASADGDPIVPGDSISLTGATTRVLTVRGTLDRSVSLPLHDVVLVSGDDARLLLGLAPGEASDLAVDVYNETEEEAILPDLVASFPYQVQVVTKRDAIGAAVTSLSRNSGLATVMIIPAVLAMAFLVTSAARGGASVRREIGLYKALGWTTADLMAVHLYRSIALAVPATLLGFATAFVCVFWPGTTWPGRILMGWQTSAPRLWLDPSGAWIVLLGVAALVLVPWLLASIIPALRGALADPEDLLRGGGA